MSKGYKRIFKYIDLHRKRKKLFAYWIYTIDKFLHARV